MMLEYDPVELLAKVLEYEHALEHVAEESGYHAPGVCFGCQKLARSALDRKGRVDFLEQAYELIEWEAAQ